MSALRCVSRLVGSLGLWCVCTAAPALADTFVGGRILDAITKRPVAGADVSVEYTSQKIGTGKTDFDGFYQVPFAAPLTAPSLTYVTVTANSADYAGNTLNLQVSMGRSAPVLNIELYPVGLLKCKSQADQTVIVGKFLPPAVAVSDLSERIAKSLEFALRTRLQTVHLTLAKQPSFQPCEAAKPVTTKLGSNYAKALKADAFVDGDVAQNEGSPGYSVSFYVSDAYDLFADPQISSNKGVDLHLPSGASVSGETHVAVLASIAAGLASKNDCTTALAVLSVAEQLVNSTVPYLAHLRKDCEARVPNVGLRRNTQ